MYRVCVLTADQLTNAHRDAWIAALPTFPGLDSPYFRPEFINDVAAVRSDVRVGVVESDGVPVGFFPFQTGSLGNGKPVGGRLSDYHGLIAGPEVAIPTAALLRGCGLRSFAFDHLVTDHPALPGPYGGIGPSRFLDLTLGFDAFVAARLAATDGRFVKEARQKQRKTERDLGPVRVELDCRDRTVFDRLLEWKSAQYERSGYADVFAHEWTVRLLERIWTRRDDGFRGLLSALWAGDRLLAMHFGMRSGPVLHYWFPAYDVECSKYSPGGMLLLELARLAAAEGVTKIDLGKGDEPYKVGFTNGQTLLAEGRIGRGGMVGRADASWRSLRGWLKQAPVAAPVRAGARALRPLRDRWAFE